MKQLSKGIIFILLSSFFFALMAALVKSVPNVPLAQKIFFRNIMGVIIMGFIIKKKNKSFFGSNIKLLVLRASFGLLGVMAYFYSLSKLPLSDAVLLNKMSPFFVLILSVIFLKEKIHKLQIYALIVAVIGTVFIIKPQFDITIIPYIIGLSASVFAGSAYVIIRELRNYASPETIVFFFCLFSSVISSPFMLAGHYTPMDITTLIILLLLGLSATTAQFLMTYAYKFAPASKLTIYSYANIIFSTIFGIILWKEYPDVFSVFGGILIVLGGYLNYLSNNLNSQEEN